MKLRQQSSTSYPITFLMVDSADHVTGKTGLTPTVTISKNGGAFGSPSGAVSEIGNGWYALAGNATDRATLGDLLIHATGTGADPVDDRYCIVPWDPFDVAALGLTNLDEAMSTRLADADYTAPLDAAGTRDALGTAGNLDSQLSTLAAYVDTEIAAILAAVDTEIAAIKAKTDGLPAIPAGVGDAMTLANDAITAAKLAADAVAEIATAIRTELATELARIDAAISTRLATAGYTAPPAVGAVADAVLDEAMTGHTTPGTAGAALAAAGSAGDPWITDLTDGTYDDPDTAGYIVARLADLDTSAVTQVAASNAGHLTITAGLSFSESVTGLTIPADWTACYWTVKRSTDDLDADALVQILVSNPGDPDDGVQVLMGTALEDESDGSLVVNQALGTVTIALGDASTALLEDAVELVWDVKVHAPGAKTQPGAGTATITTAVTRA